MTPILLYDGECGFCRRIAHWVQKAATPASGPPCLVVRAIGEDPAALYLLSPQLTIWEAYAAPHVLMPDGSIKRAGEAIAEVFRRLPSTQWFAGIFAVTIGGVQPFQILLNGATTMLADIRPLFGCESCGEPSPWVKPLLWISHRLKSPASPAPAPHFTTVRPAPAPPA